MKITWSLDGSDELRLRAGPLKEAWEARGAGLMRGIGTRIGKENLPLSATIIPVMPSTIGGGSVNQNPAEISIQAMLVNPDPALPEVARLAWLLCQLVVVDSSPVAKLALIPVVLEAAQDVELVHFQCETLAAAVTKWCDAEPTAVAATAKILCDWWNDCDVPLDGWPKSVQRLNQMLR